jgi:hypothetical protein
MAALVVPASVGFVWFSRRRAHVRRAAPLLTVCVLAPLLLYACLPLAAWRDPTANWGDARTVDNFAYHITGRLYAGKMGIRSPSELYRQLRAYAAPPSPGNPGYVLSQYPLSLAWLAPVGIAYLWQRKRRVMWMLAIAYGTQVLWGLNYRIADAEVCYVVAHLIVAIWIGCGLRAMSCAALLLLRRARPKARGRVMRVGMVGSAAFPVLLLVANWHAVDMSGSRETDRFARALLNAMPPRAVLILSGDEWGFPALYSHEVAGVRPDVTILYYLDFVCPRLHRLIARRAGDGLVVRHPSCSRRRGDVDADLCFLSAFLRDNGRARPVCLAGEEFRRLGTSKVLTAAVGRVDRLAPGQPVFRVVTGR